MEETLDRLIAHLGASLPAAKIVVWAHNSHLGDAVWTELGGRGELNLGQLVRERFPRQSHYFTASLSRQFDAVLHYDTTRAVEPLERSAAWTRGELPDTYPSTL